MVESGLVWRFDNLPYRSKLAWINDLRERNKRIMTIGDDMYLKVNGMEFAIVHVTRQDHGTMVNMHHVWHPTIKGDIALLQSEWLCLAKNSDFGTLSREHPGVDVHGQRIK